MEITLNELLENGKALVIKNQDYFDTRHYVEPFLERMSKWTDNFICQVKLPDTMTKDDGILDRGFTRVWVQAVLPEEYAFENHQQSVNLLYALDTRKPLVKLFKNTLNMACLNMCVFNPEHLQVTQLEPETPINYRFLNEVMEMADSTKMMLERYEDTFLEPKDRLDTLGKWVDNSIRISYDNGFNKVKVAESLPIEVYKDLFVDEKSDIFCDRQDAPSYYDVYNAFTYRICNDKGKDIVNKFEKTWLISKILNV